MPIVNSRLQLNQGSSLAVASAIFATGSGADIRIHTSASNLLPALAVGEKFEVRDHSDTVNNGLFEVVTINTTLDDYECDKIHPASTPIVAGSEAIITLGATGQTTEKSAYIGTAGVVMAIIEQGFVDAAGVTGPAWYGFMMQLWKDDNFLGSNARFPMLAVDNDAGKYIVGQDVNGNFSGFNWLDDTGFSIRTRKLLRNCGWNEVDANGVLKARFFCALSVDPVEDPANDTPFGQFGNDFAVDDTFDLDFAGPANEAIQFFERLADDAQNGGTGIVISTDGRTLTRSDGGDWRTDGFIQGARVAVRDAEVSANDTLAPAIGVTPGFLMSAVGAGVDGAITLGTAADAGTGFSFIDGGGGNDQIERFDGLSWIDEGYFVGGNVNVANATIGANDGVEIILAITDAIIDVQTGALTADTTDNAATFGPIDATGTPDTVVNFALNNDNAFRLGMRVRDADPQGKSYAESNLATIQKSKLGNFVFQFPLGTGQDANITETDANIIANTPYTGMSITFFSTAQARGGLVGGPYNFGIIIDGNDGTNKEVFEFVQHQLRLLTDIDDGGGTAIGRAVGLLAKFNGDVAEFGSGDFGLTFPVNPSGDGSGVFVDSLNAASDNKTKFYDNTNALRSKPESIAVTLDINQIAIDDTLFEADIFFDRTIRTNVTDFVIQIGPDRITSAGSNLPDNGELAANSYIRVSGLTGGDAAMNGVYQITAETTPGDEWAVVRHDGETIVAVTVTTADLDQNCVDTPDNIIVHTNVTVTDTTISFTNPDTIDDTNNGFGIFASGDSFEISGTASNNGIFTVDTAAAGQITTIEQTLVNESAGASMTLTKLFSFTDMTGDVTQNFAFDDNVQGGRTVSETTFVTARGIGTNNAQYISSPVQDIVSGTPEVIPMFAATELNVD